jgi:hypothetical protein
MPGAVAPDEQLEWERRAAKPAGIAAILAGLLLIGGTIIYPVAAIGSQTGGPADTLLRLNETPAHAYVPGALQALGYLLMAIPLVYLYRATKARRPELLTAAKYLAIAGPIVTAVAFMVHQVLVVQAAKDFAAERLPMTVPAGSDGVAGLVGVLAVANDRASDILSDKIGAPILVGLQYGGVLAVAFAFVLISLNAMRAGLLSRFMGIIGVIIGALTVLPLFGPSIIQVFWFGALGLILLDRWPNGRGPAWEVVESIPWPSGADQRQAQMERRAERDEPEDEDEDEDPGDGRNGSAPAPHPASKKRKKKRRR